VLVDVPVDLLLEEGRLTLLLPEEEGLVVLLFIEPEVDLGAE